VTGTRDRLCVRHWAARLVAAATRGRLVEVPGAAHMTPQSHPDEIAAVLRAVAEAPPGGRRGLPA
jgi:pimeloyl-ACP methyl ester carboxylesterase